jgi:hypothetical protein
VSKKRNRKLDKQKYKKDPEAGKTDFETGKQRNRDKEIGTKQGYRSS